ncbi:MAG: HAMP domain-containing histidine kinase [Actinomycetota bacterium]|nr:HAMP domain-containing histidine kinase [Actinomycetota bacterium]
MRPRSLFVRLTLALVALVAGALAAVYLVVVPSLEHNLVAAKQRELRRALPQIELPQSPYAWQRTAQAAAGTANARVVIFEPLEDPPRVTLVAIGDSNPAGPDLSQDPVARRALRSRVQNEAVVSRNGERYAEVAGVAGPNGPVILLSASLHDTLGSVALVSRRVLIAGAVALLAALGLGLLGSALVVRRLRNLERAAERIAGGEFDEPVQDPARDEIGELARAFERMRLRLAQLEHARREFIANASHELRTPLFSLAGFVELLADEELDEPTRREFLETMREQLDRLTRLATDLLDLSRLDAGRMHVERVPIDLGLLAQSLAEEFGPVALASGHELDAVVALETGALADEERVRQIGRILVENALNHTDAGTCVRVRARVNAELAELTVENDGGVIPEQHAEHIFDRFYRIEGTLASGSGLGLAIARELASLMGGDIALRSSRGRTAFTLTLPRGPSTHAFSRENVHSALA